MTAPTVRADRRRARGRPLPRRAPERVLLAVLLLVVLAACGSSAKPKPKPKSSSRPATSTTTAPKTLITPGASPRASPPSSGGPTGSSTPQAPAQTPAITGTPDVLGSTGPNGVVRPFDANSPWNVPVENAPLAQDSAMLIRLVQKRYGVVTGDNIGNIRTRFQTIDKPLYINTYAWSDPVVNGGQGGVSTTLTCRQINLPPIHNFCGDGWDVPTLSIPPAAMPRPQYDGWFTVVEPSTGLAYDLWRARRVGVSPLAAVSASASAGATISYQFMRKWSLSGSGFQDEGDVSARGSGLPLFAGLITPQELRTGHIDHALAISLPGPASGVYVPPASATDGNGLRNSLPEGAHIRLKSSVTLADILDPRPRPAGNGILRVPFAGATDIRAAEAIFTALKVYGAIVVDRAGTPTLYAQENYDWSLPLRNARGLLVAPGGIAVLPPAEQRDPARYGTPLLRGNEVSGLLITDFEVVKLPNEVLFPPAGYQTNAQGEGLGGELPQGSIVATAGSSTVPTGAGAPFSSSSAQAPAAGASPSGGGGGGGAGSQASTHPVLKLP